MCFKSMRSACLIITALLTVSCVEDINLDTGERILNVYCVLGEGPQQELELSYIAPTGGTSQPVGEGAAITLYEEGSPVGQFARVSETKWELNFIPWSGRTYQLEVAVPGEETLSAETTFPRSFEMDKTYVRVSVNSDTPGEGYSPTPLYNWAFVVSGNPVEDLVLWCYYESQSDRGETPFVDYIATDHPGVDKRGETLIPFDASSPLIDLYFGWDSQLQGNTYNPGGVVFSRQFYGEPAMLHEKVLRIVHPMPFERSLDNGRIDVVHDTGIGGELIGDYQTTKIFGIGGVDRAGRDADLIVCSVSAEYDQYLSDFYFNHPDLNDFTQLAYKRNHYSNVQNGTGIFGASYARICGHEYFGRLLY